MQIALLAVAALLVLLPGTAQAYVGPGLGLGAIGAILGVIFSVILAILAFFWYPIKRLFGIGKKKQENREDDPLD
ncbi:MAG: hypothetical protein KKC30_11155 [Proteobacteria bacterium]|nr:hypothetical protein [Pseudomonadota bacterium]MBU4383400.1 hypothetical protein [Pseudomonadota bacterium]MBU4604102.1 hypothetical protein [Pseudomonadota bacterium]MCG2763346.1 hypothetical protein [Desulfarculaceae bacterium]